MAYEDFTGFTEVDEGAEITIVSAAKVSWASLETTEYTSYVYKSKGAGYFSGDFTHQVEMSLGAYGAYTRYYYWMLSNIIGDTRDVVDQSEDGHFFGFDSLINNPVFSLGVIENGAESDDVWAGPTQILYFVEIVRDDDGGANNTGRLTAYIRTGSHSGALQDTLVIDCAAGEQNDFQYVYAISTYDTGWTSGNSGNGYTQNLSLGERALGANDVSNLTQITAPLLTVKRQFAIPNIESLSQITTPTVERGWLYPPDIPCDTQVTVPSFSVKRQLSIPNIECLSQVTVASMSRNHLGANNISCDTEITVPSFSVKREVVIPNVESSTEVVVPAFVRIAPLNAPDIACNTEVTAAGIYKELFPSDIECSSEVEAADLEWIKILKLNATLPMITAEMSGGHGGFLNVELPMITAEMRGGAQLNVTLPMITAEIEGSVGIKADLNVTLPMIKAEMTGTVEVLGQLNVTLPMITARMTGTAGQVGQLNVTLPMITAELTGYTDIDGQLNVTLPMIEAYLTGTVERESCEILRYEEPELE